MPKGKIPKKLKKQCRNKKIKITYTKKGKLYYRSVKKRM